VISMGNGPSSLAEKFLQVPSTPNAQPTAHPRRELIERILAQLEQVTGGLGSITSGIAPNASGPPSAATFAAARQPAPEGPVQGFFGNLKEIGRRASQGQVDNFKAQLEKALADSRINREGASAEAARSLSGFREARTEEVLSEIPLKQLRFNLEEAKSEREILALLGEIDNRQRTLQLREQEIGVDNARLAQRKLEEDRRFGLDRLKLIQSTNQDTIENQFRSQEIGLKERGVSVDERREDRLSVEGRVQMAVDNFRLGIDTKNAQSNARNAKAALMNAEVRQQLLPLSIRESDIDALAAAAGIGVTFARLTGDNKGGAQMADDLLQQMEFTSPGVDATSLEPLIRRLKGQSPLRS